MYIHMYIYTDACAHTCIDIHAYIRPYICIHQWFFKKRGRSNPKLTRFVHHTFLQAFAHNYMTGYIWLYTHARTYMQTYS